MGNEIIANPNNEYGTSTTTTVTASEHLNLICECIKVQ